jgi:RNA polymerase sigma-70 factor (ECF subfamily)
MNQAQAIVLYQPMLHTIAYNLVRCKADAEDIVQETFLKWLCIDQQKIENTKAYLIRAVTNNCLNHLNALKNKKTEQFEVHLHDFLNKVKDVHFSKIDLDANLKAAFKVLHTKLEPLERAVFLLKEVFDVDYETLHKALDKKKDHCRQLVSRAKKKLSEETSKIHIELPDTSKLLESFRHACDFNSMSGLIQELKTDITYTLRKKS